MSNIYQVFNLDTGEMREARHNAPLDECSPNLYVSEFASRDGNEIVPYHPDIAEVFQIIRDKYGPLEVGRGFTSNSHNKTIPGASLMSKHKDGTAIDIIIPNGIKGEVFLIEIIGMIGTHYGFGLYDNHIHIDLRGEFVFWDSRK